jgi:hypothetical protein
MMKTNLTKDAESIVSEFLQSLGGTAGRMERPPGPGSDIILEAEIRGKSTTLIAECKSQGELRLIGEAAEQLREFRVNYRLA